MKMGLIGQWATYNMEAFIVAAFASAIKKSRYLSIFQNKKVISEKTFFRQFIYLSPRIVCNNVVIPETTNIVPINSALAKF